MTRRHLSSPLTMVVLAIALASCGGSPDGGPGDGDAPPDAPTNVRTQSGAGYVVVAWDHDGEGATSFEVRREDAVAAGLALQNEPIGTADASDRTFVDGDVAEERGYRYEVVALGAGGARSDPVPQGGEPATPGPSGTDAGQNPDPERYMAVRVLDEMGRARPNALVTFLGLTEAGDGHSFTAVTDAEGVAVATDTIAQPETIGRYDGWMWVQTAAPVRTPQLYELNDVEMPGTLTADPRSESLVDVSLSITDGGEPGGFELQLGVALDGEPALSESLSVPELPTDARLTPGTYPVVITARDLDGIGYHLWDELTVDGPTRYWVEVTSRPAATVTLSGEIAGDGAVQRLSICPSRQTDEVKQASSLCIRAGTIHFTPATYAASAILDVIASDGVAWDYRFSPLTLNLDEAGDTVDLVVGGALQATFQAEQDSYTPGDEVGFAGVLSDANGAPVRSIRRDVGGSWSAVLATVEVRDPSDALVSSRELQLFELFRADDNAVTLPPDAPIGSYQVQMTLETGPLSGTVVASDTFAVVASE